MLHIQAVGRRHSWELSHTLSDSAGTSSSPLSFSKVHHPVVWWEMQRATYSPPTSAASSPARQWNPPAPLMLRLPLSHGYAGQPWRLLFYWTTSPASWLILPHVLLQLKASRSFLFLRATISNSIRAEECAPLVSFKLSNQGVFSRSTLWRKQVLWFM